MRLSLVLAFSPLFISQVFSQDLQARLREVGLSGFAEMLAVYNPSLLAEVGRRDDITVWAPGDHLVASLLATINKRDANDMGSATSRQLDHKPEPPKTAGDPSKRQVQPPRFPNTNFETIHTFLNDSDFVNLGPEQGARFTKSYGVSLDGGVTSAPSIDVLSGLGDTQSTLRGPFKFSNGVIYEINSFFTYPQSFTTTMHKIKSAQNFYNAVVSCGKLSLFEETPAVTVFAPIDSSFTTEDFNPESYILSGPLSLYYTPALIPGNTIVTTSGGLIDITKSATGERLVNCRRLVRPNIPMKNGVIHFIDGPLYGPGGCNGTVTGNSTSRPTGPPPTHVNVAARQGVGAGALVLALAASLLAFC